METANELEKLENHHFSKHFLSFLWKSKLPDMQSEQRDGIQSIELRRPIECTWKFNKLELVPIFEFQRQN